MCSNSTPSSLYCERAGTLLSWRCSTNGSARLASERCMVRYPASSLWPCYCDKTSWHQHFPNVHFAVQLQNTSTLSNIFPVLRSFSLYSVYSSTLHGGNFCACLLVLRGGIVWSLGVGSALCFHLLLLAVTTENKETTWSGLRRWRLRMHFLLWVLNQCIRGHQLDIHSVRLYN